MIAESHSQVVRYWCFGLEFQANIDAVLGLLDCLFHGCFTCLNTSIGFCNLSLHFKYTPLFFFPLVNQRSDRLRVGGSQPVRLPAAGEPTDHPWHQTVRASLLSGDLPQLQTGRVLRSEAAGAAQPHRSESSIDRRRILR